MLFNPRYLKTIFQYILLPVLVIYLFLYLLSYMEYSGRAYDPNVQLIPAVNTNNVGVTDSPSEPNDKPIRIEKKYPDFNIEDFNFTEDELSKLTNKINNESSTLESVVPSLNVDNSEVSKMFNQSDLSANDKTLNPILSTTGENDQVESLEPSVKVDSLNMNEKLREPNDIIISPEQIFLKQTTDKAKSKEELVEPNEITNEWHFEPKLETQSETTNKKTILLWNNFRADYSFFGTNGSAFVGEKRCPVENCVVTHDRNLMPLNEYDVIAFHIWNSRSIVLPETRNEKQYYAFVSLESPNRSRLSKVAKDFFNWTVTYRLDSDFPWPYFKVMDEEGIVVAPLLTSKWHNPDDDTADIGYEILSGLNKKSKKIAWFVNRCHTNSHRELYVRDLQKYIDVDVYGVCGPLTCPKATEDECFDIVKKDYYFYLAFENSYCPDYVTEEVINALQHDTVPIVFGGANYSNFLPPMSFIDANDYEPKDLAQLIEDILVDKDQYAQFFWWKKFYNFHIVGRSGDLPNLHPFCDICKALNDPNLQPKRYDNIKTWWNGNSSNPDCQ